MNKGWKLILACMILLVCCMAAEISGNAAAESAKLVWPPAGKQEVSSDDSSLLLVYNCPSTADGEYLYVGGEPVSEGRILPAGGDSSYENALYLEKDGESGTVLRYNADAVHTDGEAVFLLETESEHYYTTRTLKVQFAAFESVQIIQKAERLNCIVGETVENWMIGEQLFQTVPAFSQGIRVSFSSRLDLDGYRIDGSGFTAKKEGNYRVQTALYLGANGVMMDSRWIIIHADSQENADAGWETSWPPEGKTEGKTSCTPEELSGVYICGFEKSDEVRGEGGSFYVRLYQGENYDFEKAEEVTEGKVTQLSGDESLRDICRVEGSSLRFDLGDIHADGQEASYRADLVSGHCYASLEFTVRLVDFSRVEVRLDAEEFEAAEGQPWDVISEVLSDRVHITPEMKYYGSIRTSDGELHIETDEYMIDWGSRFTGYQTGSYPLSLYLNLGKNSVMISRPVTLNVKALEDSEAEWAGSWPPAGRTQVSQVKSYSALSVEEDLNGTYFINGGYSGSLGLAPYYLVDQNGTEEPVQKYHVTFLSGDEHLRGLFSPGMYSPGEANLNVGYGSIGKPGTAEFRIDMISGHYYASVTAHPVLTDAKDVRMELLSAEVNVKTGEPADIPGLYEERAFIRTEPVYEYSCSIMDGNTGDIETDSYRLQYWRQFTAKIPGDYQLTLAVYINSGYEQKYTITVHASDNAEKAAVVGDAPKSAMAVRREQEEAEARIRLLEEGREEGSVIAKTENAAFRYVLKEDGAVIQKIAAMREELVIPAVLDGHPVGEVGSRVLERSGSVQVKTLIIEEGIRRIGDYAFSYSMDLERLQLPESLVSIGRGAFSFCHSLNRVNLPAGLTVGSIGTDAFDNIGADSLTLSDGTDLMALSLEAYRREGRYASGMIMCPYRDGFGYLVRPDGGAVIVYGYGDAGFVIPESLGSHPVREIGDSAFEDCHWMESLILPEGVETIGKRAFYGCENLKTVRLPSTITWIGSKAFIKTATEEIRLPEGGIQAAEDWYVGPEKQDETGKWRYCLLADQTAAIVDFTYSESLDFPPAVDGYPVTVIQAGSGNGADRVREATIPDTVRVIDEAVFSGMNGLEKIILPAGLERIGAGAFSNTGLKEIIIPEGVTVIEEGTFDGCSFLKTVKLPSELREIGNGAFRNCGLTSVSFPESLRVIGEKAFHSHQIKDLTIPAGVTRIGNGAFSANGDKAPERVTFMGPRTELGRGVLGYDDGSLDYYRAHYEEIQANGGSYSYDSGNPENWKDCYAEETAGQVHTIIITCYPGSTADQLFRYNVRKTYLTWGQEGTKTAPADRVLTAGLYQPDETVYELIIPEGVEEIAEGALAGLKTLNRVQLPSTLTAIGARAFDGCGALTELKIPKSVTYIGEACFRDCVSLKSISLPDGITEIPDGAFSGCKELAKLETPKSGLKWIGNEAFYGCGALTSVKLGKNLEEIGEKAFCSSGLKKIQIPNRAVKIGKQAFAFTGLTSLTLPKGITEIPDMLCCGSQNLKSVKIPAGVTHIGDQAFAYCRLTGLKLPEGLVSIGERAFMQDPEGAALCYQTSGGKKSYSSLKSLKIPASLEKIGAFAFAANDALTGVAFAKNARLKEIGENAFVMCIHLKEIRLPDALQTIGAHAFENCAYMKKADLGGGVTEIGEQAFLNDEALTSLKVPDSLRSIGDKILEGHGEKLKVTCGQGSAMETWLKDNDPEVAVVYPKK